MDTKDPLHEFCKDVVLANSRVILSKTAPYWFVIDMAKNSQQMVLRWIDEQIDPGNIMQLEQRVLDIKNQLWNDWKPGTVNVFLAMPPTGSFMAFTLKSHEPPGGNS